MLLHFRDNFFVVVAIVLLCDVVIMVIIACRRNQINTPLLVCTENGFLNINHAKSMSMVFDNG